MPKFNNRFFIIKWSRDAATRIKAMNLCSDINQKVDAMVLAEDLTGLIKLENDIKSLIKKGEK